MKIHMVARSQASIEAFRGANETLRNVEFHLGAVSYFELINSVILDDSEDYAVIVHDDVFLPKDFNLNLDSLIKELNAEWPNWGGCGNAGIGSLLYGGAENSIIRYLFDPHGGPTQVGEVLPVESIDGNVMLLNCKALRTQNVVLPKFFGFQLYDISFSIETVCAGLAVLVSPKLACYHDSNGNQNQFNIAKASEAFKSYLSEKVSNRYIKTLNGNILIPFKGYGKALPDLEIASLRNAAKNREKRHVAIVVRSQFRNLSLLRRTLETIASFIASSGQATKFTPIVITDKAHMVPDFVTKLAQIITVSNCTSVDSRSFLIRSAVCKFDADFYWFVDDDDWLFPNEAERIALTIASIPLRSIVFADSQHFNETFSDKADISGRLYSIFPGRYFTAVNWTRGLSGHNHIPFCGVLFNAKTLKNLDEDVYERMTYYEDYALQLFSILDPKITHVVVPKLISGISVRNLGDNVELQNSITEKNRTKWHKANAELAVMICSKKINSVMFGGAFRNYGFTNKAENQSTSMQIGRVERKILVLYRLGKGIVRFLFSPYSWKRKLVHFFRGYKTSGIRGFVRAIGDL